MKDERRTKNEGRRTDDRAGRACLVSSFILHPSSFRGSGGVAVPRLSIVLPNYNYAGYLDERIQSLLAQTHGDFELLILDDASRDNSREVIERYTHDRRVRAHYYAENSGSTYPRWNDGA